MSDKHLGRIENTSDSGKQPQYAQPWTPQMMTPKLDLSGSAPQVPSEFGNLQITYDGQKPLQGAAEVKHKAETPVYHSAYDQLDVPQQHHNRLYSVVSDGNSQGHRQPQQQHHREQMYGGTATIPESQQRDGHHASETISTSLKASDYHEGQYFPQVLNIPAERGKTNYYNGLANAHFEHGHLYGNPVHVVNGRTATALNYQVDIELKKK
ncbi:MAG: hypothetical protein JST89_21510 [Cyanobacteria bacterium SZAS-4]|nr:hypothetical protein [Cyanobacteria bacterium SZAS-4]